MPLKIILTRKGEFINRRQRFKVFINNKEAGLINNDDSKEYELEPGTYTVQCKLNWMSSPIHTVDLKDGENAYLRVSNGMKYYFPLYIMMLVGLFLPFFLKIGKVPVPAWISTLKIILIVPALLYVIVYMSFLKGKYLSLTEDKGNPFANK
ncbi:hypothetical protein [Segetibacter koreensis]|uniref:hypothetical protein n=1 Tax=Segetibacter koreensis TaxID=398037 RepID=UPI000379AFEB|nr:hypothetical protein [Segetibacter koreensis]